MLDKAFEVWYPTLEKDLNELHDLTDEDVEDSGTDIEAHMSSIIEELLELSRDNQKLLRNPDPKLFESIDDLKQRIDYTMSRIERNAELEDRRISRRNRAMYLDEILHGFLPDCNKQYAFLILLSLIQEEIPWIYNMGKGLIDVLNSRVSTATNLTAINDFRRLMEFSFDHPAMRENLNRRRDTAMIQKEVPYVLSDILFAFEKELN